MDQPKRKKHRHHRPTLNYPLLLVAFVFFFGVLGMVAHFETKGKTYLAGSAVVDPEIEQEEQVAGVVEPIYINEQIAVYHEPSLIPQDTNYHRFDFSDLSDIPRIPDLSDESNSRPGVLPVCLTPMQALKTGQISKVYNLIAVEGIGLNEIDPSNGYTLMHYLAMTHDFSSLERLLAADTYREIGGVNAQSHDGNTPLHLALRYPYACMASVLAHYLICFDADPNIPNNQGETPIQIARIQGNGLIDVLNKDYRFMRDFGPVEIFRLLFNNQTPQDPIYPYCMTNEET